LPASLARVCACRRGRGSRPPCGPLGPGADIRIPSWPTEPRRLAPNVYAYTQASGPGVDNARLSNADFIAGAEVCPPSTRWADPLTPSVQVRIAKCADEAVQLRDRRGPGGPRRSNRHVGAYAEDHRHVWDGCGRLRAQRVCHRDSGHLFGRFRSSFPRCISTMLLGAIAPGVAPYLGTVGVGVRG
jgi:hypothetical protein